MPLDLGTIKSLFIHKYKCTSLCTHTHTHTHARTHTHTTKHTHNKTHTQQNTHTHTRHSHARTHKHKASQYYPLLSLHKLGHATQLYLCLTYYRILQHTTDYYLQLILNHIDPCYNTIKRVIIEQFLFSDISKRLFLHK